MRLGYQVALPYGEDCDYDLILVRSQCLERVQVKYVKSDGRVINLRCRSHSLTNGRVRQTKHYTAESVDWLAVYDETSDRCLYVPAMLLGEGRWQLSLRLEPARNGQRAGVNDAGLFNEPTLPTTLSVKPAIDGASGIRTRDLSDANRTL